MLFFAMKNISQKIGAYIDIPILLIILSIVEFLYSHLCSNVHMSTYVIQWYIQFFLFAH